MREGLWKYKRFTVFKTIRSVHSNARQKGLCPPSVPPKTAAVHQNQGCLTKGTYDTSSPLSPPTTAAVHKN